MLFFAVYLGLGVSQEDAIHDSLVSYVVVAKPDTYIGEGYEAEKYDVKMVKNGDSYGKILGNMRFENDDIFRSAASLRSVFKPERLKVGDRLHINYVERVDENGEIESRQISKIRIAVKNFSSEYEVVNNFEDKFVSREISQQLVMKPRLVSSAISSSLYYDASSSGVPSSIIADFTSIFSFDLDFQRDIMKDDTFKIFFEAFYDTDGNFVKAGKIIYSEYKSKKLRKDIKNYRYKTTKGSIVYLDPDGKSVKRALLLTPINGARISSNFGPRRHPILGYTKMHKGTDFAAPTGTPIYAAGNGKITRIGWNGAYGKYIKIRHNKTYSTAYAHMSGFKKGVKKGSFVKQGDVIGYVGSTGRSTGPHLHYEVLKNNKQINPRNMKAQSQVKLYGKELANFSSYKDRVDFIMYNAYASLMTN